MSLLPPNATPVETAIESLASHVRDLPVVIRRLWNPATCPAPFLPWLAWALSVDIWRSDWTEAVKRQAIADSPAAHRIKGSVASVKAAVMALGLPVRTIDWFETGGSGQPYVAIVESEIAEPTDADVVGRVDDIARAIALSAPAHVKLVTRLATTAGGGFAQVGHLNRPLTLARFSVGVA